MKRRLGKRTGTALETRASSDYAKVLAGVAELLEAARRASARVVNSLMTATYWEIGASRRGHDAPQSHDAPQVTIIEQPSFVCTKAVSLVRNNTPSSSTMPQRPPGLRMSMTC